MEWVSYLFGSWRAALLVALGGLLVWWRAGLLESLLVWAAGLITPINYLFKYIVNRSRPSPDLVNILVDESDLGFPSGHAFFSLIFLGILAYIISCHLRNPWHRILSLAALSLLILLVGVSRIYLGVHWPSDVLGGYLFGGFFLILLVLFYRSFKKEP
jgi:undecaprenyl-diphosphatase